MKMNGAQRMLLPRRLSAQRSRQHWCREPVAKFDPGGSRHHRLLLPWGSTHSRLCDIGPPPLRPSLGRRCRMVAVVYDRCCGLDVHQQTVVACLITPGPDGQPAKEVRTFGTMTADLLELADWLRAAACAQVAMEATGVYWKPIWNLLEDEFTLVLVNARHIKAVPGRKTDVKDCEWLAALLRLGLLRASFVPARPPRGLRGVTRLRPAFRPARPQRELGELTRYRTALVRERAAAIQRLHKTLEGANLKLGSVASQVLGVSGRQIVEALLAGTTDPAVLADLAKGKLRTKLPQLE